MNCVRTYISTVFKQRAYMTAVTDFLLNRSSEPRLESPAPDSTTLERAFSCAARAPDHALLRPWRYLVIEGKGLEALGELFASTCANNSDEKEIEKLRRAPLRAPCRAKRQGFQILHLGDSSAPPRLLPPEHALS